MFRRKNFELARDVVVNIASLQFVVFTVVAACAYNLFRSVMWRQLALLAVNLLFLATFTSNAKAYLPFAGFLLLGFVAVQAVQHAGTRKALVPFLILVLGVFVWLKKYTFLPSASFLRFSYVTIGLSYVLFRILHLIIDAHANSLNVKITPLSYLNYTLNFLTLISGPIQRYEDFAVEQLAPVRRPLTIFAIGEGIHRIVAGFFKVIVLSWLLSMLHQQALGALTEHPLFRWRLFIAATIAVSYPLYLYFNFSGYMDIVIGAGRFFTFTLPENFDRPFFSDSFIDFWSRWHITLSNWLKTYVFNSLLLVSMRRISSRALETFLAVPAFFITFFLVGIWHGQTSEFVVFGLLQGFGVAANQLYRILMVKGLGQEKFRLLTSNRIYVALSRGLTFSWFTFTLFWFWSNWNQMREIILALHSLGVFIVSIMIFVASTIVLSVIETVRDTVLAVKWNGSPVVFSRYMLTIFDTGLMVISLAVVLLLNAPAPDIVYKAF